MNVTLTIPESIFEQNGGQIARELLEWAALEAFRVGAISLGRLAEILELTVDEANAFLKAHNTRSKMTAADIEEGRATLKAIFGQ